MKILLISPRMSLRPMDSEYKRLLSPALGLLVLGQLTPPEHEVILHDENLEDLDPLAEADLVGITVNVDNARRAYNISAQFRQRGIPVIMGGIHVSANPEEALRWTDAVCVGEAEISWPRILDDLKHGRLKKIYRQDSPADTSTIPPPRWDLIDRNRYLYTNIISSSRGCPFHCEFCYNSCSYSFRRHRPRPIDDIMREIDRTGSRHIMFIDDNFIGNREWTWEFCIRAKDKGIKWNAAVSANLVHDLPLLDKMADAGCQSLFIGFETINPQALEGVSKKQNKVSSFEKLIEEIHNREIMINASLAFGFDQDDKEVFSHTLDWLVHNKIETMTAHILTPYPGTLLHSKLDLEGRIIDKDTNHYNTAHVVFEPARMSQKDLYQGYIWIYKEFYTMKNILRRLPKSRKQRLPYLLFNLGYRKFGRFTSRFAGRKGMSWIGKLARRLAYGID